MDNHGTLHPLLPRHGDITIICLASRSLLLMFDDESPHLRGSMLVIEDICLEASFWKTSFKKECHNILPSQSICEITKIFMKIDSALSRTALSHVQYSTYKTVFFQKLETCYFLLPVALSSSLNSSSDLQLCTLYTVQSLNSKLTKTNSFIKIRGWNDNRLNKEGTYIVFSCRLLFGFIK